ncbi:MAG: hypothetical protein KC431_31225, partial [Myxococcales bacterium]|nr:hypothetical protein [Myxococcales bacterium]
GSFSRARTPGLVGLVLASVLGLSCVFQVPSPTYIGETRLIAVQTSVAEFGPLYSSRPEHGEPVAEVMPGDIKDPGVLFRGVDGLPLAVDAIDSMWLQCGALFCDFVVSGPDLAAYTCADQAAHDNYDGNTGCLLGKGDGHFEFEAPEVVELSGIQRNLAVYGVLAWDGMSAETCWQQRRALDQEIENCAFVEHRVYYGPEWLVQLHGYDQGLEPDVPIDQIPAAVFGQPANRPPALQEIQVEHDGVVDVFDPREMSSLPAVATEPGAEIVVTIAFDELLQLQQPIFSAKAVESSNPDPEAEPSYVFVGSVEPVYLNLFTSNALHVLTEPFLTDTTVELFIDDQAKAGSSWALFVLRDFRGGESVVWLEFTH